MKLNLIVYLFCLFPLGLLAQEFTMSNTTEFVKKQNRIKFKEEVSDNVKNFFLSDKTDTLYDTKIKIACWSAVQFNIKTDSVRIGTQKCLDQFSDFNLETKFWILSTAYGLFENSFYGAIKNILLQESNEKLFAIEALYLLRIDSSDNTKQILIKKEQELASQKNEFFFAVFNQFIQDNHKIPQKSLPPLSDLFRYQQKKGVTTMYSFQRKNRNFPGLAVVQSKDGLFKKDNHGAIVAIQQLARSASNLPYFLTNGNTPQGIYKIIGTDISTNKFIGPTPNIQMIMPYEVDRLYWQHEIITNDTMQSYLNLLPDSWRNYAPMMQNFYAGKIGRSEIIVHGTTIDPSFYKGMPFYPLTPSLGCLCAKELWNENDGTIADSEQLKLIRMFSDMDLINAMVIVIEIDDKDEPVTVSEISKLIADFK